MASNTNASRSSKRRSNSADRNTSKKTENGNPADLPTTVESALKALPKDIATACPGLSKNLETLQLTFINEAIPQIKGMRKETDLIDQKLAAINEFENTKVTIDGEQLPYQPANIQRKHPLTSHNILKDNPQAQELLEAARKLQLEINAAHAATAQKLAKLALAAFYDRRLDLFLDALYETSHTLVQYHRRNHQTTATLLDSELALMVCYRIFLVENNQSIFSDTDLTCLHPDLDDREQFQTRITAHANDHPFNSGSTTQMSHDDILNRFRMNTDGVFVEHLTTSIAGPLIYQMTIGAWKNLKEAKEQKSVEADIAALYKKKNVEKANNALAEAMDIDDDGGNEKILDRVKATCQNEVKRLLRKEEAKQRKKSGARGNVPPRKPGNGQSTNDQSRSRSRSPSNRQSGGSPTNSTKQNQRSKKKNHQRSILKSNVREANVRWQENYSRREPSDEEEKEDLDEDNQSSRRSRKSSRRGGGHQSNRGGSSRGRGRGKGRRN